MKDTKPTYEQLASRLAEAEKVIEAIGSGQADAIVSQDQVMMLRLKEAEEALRESEQRLRLAAQAANFGVYDADLIAGTVYWSAEMRAILGLSPDASTPEPGEVPRFIHPDDVEHVREMFRDAFDPAGSGLVQNEHRIVRPDGTVRWIMLKGQVEFDPEQGRRCPVRSRGIMLDITERKLAEVKVDRLAKFPSENPFPVLRVSQDGTISHSNIPGLVLLRQWGREIGQKAPHDWCIFVKKALQSKRYLVEQVQCDDKVFSVAMAPIVEGGYVNLYGTDITVQEQIKDALRRSRDELELRVKERTAELAQTVSALREEVQERISAEEALRQRTRDLDAFFANTIEPLAILDKDFNFVRVNRAYAEAGRRDVSEFAGHNHFELYPHEENQRIFEEAVRTKTPYQARAKPFLYPGQPQRGITYWDWTLVPVLDDRGDVQMVLLSLRDVSPQKRAELALRESEQKYRSLVEVSPEAICVAIDEKVAFVNTAALKLIGTKNAEEMVERPMWGFIHPDSAQLVRNDIAEILEKHGKVPPREAKLIRLDGSTVDVEVSATAIVHYGKTGVLAIFHDITERKRAQVRKAVTNSLLELFAQKTSRAEYLDSVVETIRDWGGCRCVGIRLVNADGYIPYESCAGFSEEFLSEEGTLSLNGDVCVCVRVVSQSPEPRDARVMTPKGSFRCDNTFNFVASLSENEKKRFRGNCVKAGFASVAVVPIRYRGIVLGAIHLADEVENKVPLDTVEFLEDMAALVGEAVHRFDVEASLRLNEQRLLEAQKLAHLGNWDWDIIRNRLWWSDEVYHIFGVNPQEFQATYEGFLSYVHPDDRELVEESVNKALYQAKSYSIDHRVIRPDGNERIVHEKAEVVYDTNQKPVRMIGTVHDVSERKKAEEEVRRNEQQLRSLTAQLQLTEERERRRIAHDLHDSVGQTLAFSGRELRSLKKSVPAQAAKGLQDVIHQLDAAVKQTRTLSFNLSPSTLYDLGFEDAVEELTERFAEDRKMQCRFENSDEPKPLSDTVKILLYRSIRELLINVAKHAKARSARVCLARDNNDIRVVVEDNGKGFDPAILRDKAGRREGFGLFSIRERLISVGGRFEVESAKGQGAKFTLLAPLQAEADQDKG